MSIYFRKTLLFAVIVFVTSASVGAGPGKPLRTPSAAPQTPPALFTVPQIHKVDTAHRATGAKKTPAPKDSLKSPRTADSARPALKVIPDTLKTMQWSGTTDTQRIATKQSPTPPKPDPKHAASLKKLHARGKGIGALIDLRYCILLLSIIIIGIWLQYTLRKANQPTFVTTTRLSIMDKEVQTACRYIEKNYKNPELSLETICEALITGKAFLGALFHQELGLSVEIFITHVRINRARMLIEKNTLTEAETAAIETGFQDASSFSDAFNSIVGVPFEEYRDSRAKNVA